MSTRKYDESTPRHNPPPPFLTPATHRYYTKMEVQATHSCVAQTPAGIEEYSYIYISRKIYIYIFIYIYVSVYIY